MIRYFFFKTIRINGWQKLRALPGQTTYKDLSHRFDPVNTEWDVQVERAQRTIHAWYPDGTIYVGTIEGRTERDVKLLFHSRDGVEFYRFAGTLKPVCLDYRQYTSESHRPSDAETAAWLDYVNSTTQPAPAYYNPQPQDVGQTVSLSRAQMLRLAGLGEERINEMAASVNTDADLHTVLLKLSQLRDRMAVGVARFTFIKQNGDTRVAYGTRCPEIIEMRPNANDTQNHQHDGAHFPYYDLQRQDWRCFCVHDFVDLDMSYFAQTPSQIALIPSDL